jgi:ribonuclease BN (tRNA processing enzyme)
MDAAEAGREATRAGASRLLLAHVPMEIGAERVFEMARSQYAGPIDLAAPGVVIEL